MIVLTVFPFIMNQSFVSTESDRADSFQFDYEPNGIPICSKNRMENTVTYYTRAHIPCNLLKESEIFFSLHTEKYFRNLIKSTRNQIVFTIFRLIWNPTDVRLVSNQSENGIYND